MSNNKQNSQQSRKGKKTVKSTTIFWVQWPSHCFNTLHQGWCTPYYRV